ncbi:hypothetical protein [Bifidobacterium biavatii]|uniref:Uncharacterized protein n=1 Tax=Bifidobacterium biavatii DSM 23969 TaxID=1437608 RepID=A0A086ZQ92_9BIFI|nr:hypothetical protein [Bifidobacterium biavatii]KFI48692.1 hypothetical protein BBIA_2230 [Bifidobacterium biavatii DSM 23969]
MDDLGLPESVVDSLLQDAIKQCSDRIRKKDDGFYYPIDEQHFPFRIIRHREIGFISIREIAFIMRRIVQVHPGKDKNWLFDETFAIYGFRRFSAKIERAFDAAYRYLTRNHFVADRNGAITLLSESAIL